MIGHSSVVFRGEEIVTPVYGRNLVQRFQFLASLLHSFLRLGQLIILDLKIVKSFSHFIRLLCILSFIHSLIHTYIHSFLDLGHSQHALLFSMTHRRPIWPCYLQKHSAGLGREQNDGFLTSFDFLHHRVDKLQSFVFR